METAAFACARRTGGTRCADQRCRDADRAAGHARADWIFWALAWHSDIEAARAATGSGTHTWSAPLHHRHWRLRHPAERIRQTKRAVPVPFDEVAAGRAGAGGCFGGTPPADRQRRRNNPSSFPRAPMDVLPRTGNQDGGTESSKLVTNASAARPGDCEQGALPIRSLFNQLSTIAGHSDPLRCIEWPWGFRQHRLIEGLQYAPYFLTVNAIVQFARSKDILCQGRGSAANSAVCYVLGITSIDPERNNLLFERRD